MKGFGVFLAKELWEIRRTWRIWVIPGLTIFFAITGPFIALLTPALVESLAGSQPGMVIKVPDPTARDAFGQFLKNLSQVVMIALVITGAGTVSGERSSGTAILVLTKPVSRAAFVVAKVVSQQILLVGSTILGVIVTVAVTAALFDQLPVRDLVAASAIWLAFALLFAGIMVLFSVLFQARGAAAGAGIGTLFVVLILSAWEPVSRWTFAGLPGASAAALGARPVFVVWPLVTALVALVAAVAAAVGIFAKKEI